MNIYDHFPSNYLKSADLQGRRIRARIKEITEETLGDNSKMVLHFEGHAKGMVCNRTNALTLAEAWGPETDGWIGGDIEIMSVKVPFQGKLTDGLRVRPLPNKPAATPPPASEPPPPTSAAEYGADEFDDIPF